MRFAFISGLVAVAGAMPAAALAQCDRPAMQLDEVFASATFGEFANNSEQSLGIGASFVADCRYTLTASLDETRRFGQTGVLGAASMRVALQGDRSVVFGALAGNGADYSPSWGIHANIDQAHQNETGPLAGIVVGLGARYVNYSETGQNLDFVSVGPTFELYPRNLNLWLSGRLAQSWTNGEALPIGGFLRLDVPWSDAGRMFISGSATYEAERGSVERVEGTSFGLVVNTTNQLRLSVVGASLDRSRVGRANEVTFVIGRDF